MQRASVRRLPFSSLSAIIFLHSISAQAQTAPTGTAPQEALDDRAIADIVVTAERRSQRLQEVPIAITAVTSEQLSAQGVTNYFEVSKITPSLVTGRTVGFGTPFMRGIGSTSVQIGDEVSVASYVDNFYQGLSITSQLPFNNIERVEILKGPQGTLYGRNAVGGLINIITRNPSQTFSMKGSAGYSNYDTITADAYITGPITDRISADISGVFRDQGKGYSRDLVSGRTAGRNEYEAVRGKLMFEFGDGDSSLLIGGGYAHSNNDIANVNSPFPGSTPLTAFPGVVYGQKRGEFAASLAPRFEVEQWDVNATLKIDLGFADLVSLSQYRKVSSVNQVEGDGTSADGLIVLLQDGVVARPDGSPGRVGDPLVPAVVAPGTFSYYNPTKTPYFVTQEIQLVSSGDGPLSWILGAFYQASKDRWAPLELDFTQAAVPAGTNFHGSPIASFDAFQATRALAGFAQMTYKFDSGLSLTGGVRYSTEKKRTGGTLTALTPTGFGNVLAGLPLTVADYAPVTNDQSKRFNSFTYRLTADYRINPDVMVYVTTSKGFKSGVFNVANFGDAPVKPEILYAYEVGVKADPSPLVRINASAYYYNYKDIQTFVNNALGTSNLLNAGGANMYGFEMESEVRPFDGFSIHTGFGYEHATYKNFENAAVFLPSPSGGNYTATENVNGNRVLRTPELTANLGLSYVFAIGNGNVTLNGSVAYTGDFFWESGNRFRQNEYALVDGSIRYATEGEGISLTAWVKNASDVKYTIYRNPQARYDSHAWAEPRTYGVTAGFAF